MLKLSKTLDCEMVQLKSFFSSFTVLFVLSVIVLYVFIFFIMLHPVEPIDEFLEVSVGVSASWGN